MKNFLRIVCLLVALGLVEWIPLRFLALILFMAPNLWQQNNEN